jgi:hypothetical protein
VERNAPTLIATVGGVDDQIPVFRPSTGANVVLLHLQAIGLVFVVLV